MVREKEMIPNTHRTGAFVAADVGCDGVVVVVVVVDCGGDGVVLDAPPNKRIGIMPTATEEPSIAEVFPYSSW